MTLNRTLLFLSAFFVLTAAGAWLWQSGEWRRVVVFGPALADAVNDKPALADAGNGTQATSAGAVAASDDESVINVPSDVVTWRDADGTVHFSRGGSVPAGAQAHTFGKPGTMADYEKALKEKGEDELPDMEAIYRARQARDSESAP